MYIHVRVQTEAKREEIRKRTKDSFLVSVREKAENNRANKAVLSLLASHLKLPVGKLRMINGHHQPSKIISIEEK